MIAPVILFFLMLSLPESPRWHLLKARRLERYESVSPLRIERHYEAALNALRRLRRTKLQAGRDLFLIDAWLRMRESEEQSHNSEVTHTGRGVTQLFRRVWLRNTLNLFRDPRCRRAMTAGLIVMSLQQLCGVNVLAYYSSPVFKDSLPDLLSDKEKDNTALRVCVPMGNISFF